jgi:cytochrome c2
MNSHTHDIMREGLRPYRWAFGTLGLAALVVLAPVGCTESAAAKADVERANPERGAQLFRRYGCHTCHTAQPVAGARANVGPPLDGIATRTYAGGALNTRAHLTRFLREPRARDPNTPMPDVGVTPRDAEHLVDFLYTLR